MLGVWHTTLSCDLAVSELARVARTLLDRGMATRIVSAGSFERRGSKQLPAAPERYARWGAAGGVALGSVALGLLVGSAGCGGQSSVAEGEQTGGGTDIASAGASGVGGDGGGTAEDMPSKLTLSDEQLAAAVVTPPDTIDRADTTGGAWRVIEVPAATNSPNVVHTPSGWMSLSSRFLGPDAKVIEGVESALYRSTDGVHWQLLPLGPGGKNLRLQGLAFGAGRYVMVGERLGGEGVVWTSSDGEHWTESLQSLSSPFAWNTVTFVKDRFFAFGVGQLASSPTGERWTALPTHIVQHGAGAYGNGRYLLLGNGPPQISEDGAAWEEHPIDCTLPRGCITNPSGGVGQTVHYSALFAEGRFFTEELSSLDGVTWQAEPDLSPGLYIDGHFLGSSNLLAGLATWTRGGPVQQLRVVRPARAAETLEGRDWVGVLDYDAPLPETVDVPFEDGLTCETATCLGGLLLVPPPGTPPLIDHVPRKADGTPLLSHDCPVSSMLFCDDYVARTGCVCNAEAPRSPDSCDDVSQYRCAGQFETRPGEWQLDELAQGGCSCDATDPNEPPGFGRSCSAEADTCQAPLECLGIDTPYSPAPTPQPFVCTAPCTVDADCPSWEATGFCAGPVQLLCSNGTCQPRACN